MGENESEGIRVTPEAMHDLGRCPICGSENIEGGEIDIEDVRGHQEALQRMWCDDCGVRWTECYVIDRRCVWALPEDMKVSPVDVERAAAETVSGSGDRFVPRVEVDL